MAADNPISDPNEISRSRSALGLAAVIIWIVVQVCVLAACAWRMPLWATMPPTIESIALPTVLASHFVACALLWPIAFAEWRNAVTMTAAAIPLLTIGALLSGSNPNDIWLPAAVIAMWFGAFYFLARHVRADFHAAVHTCLLILVVGMPAIQYLNLEYATQSHLLGIFFQITSPTLGAASTLSHASPIWPAFVLPIVILACATMLKVFTRKQSG